MRLDFSYDQDFVQLYNSIGFSDKGKKFLNLFGISRDKLDPALMGKLYFSNTSADRSSDPNSNCGSTTKAPNHFISEIFKGLTKINSVALLHKEIKELYDLNTANKCITDLITGSLYTHDLSSSAGIAIPYCWAFSTYNILEGRKYGQLQSAPPKRSDSFLAVLVETIFELAAEQAGALALADFFVVLSYFYKSEGINPAKDFKKIENDYQRIIHSLNMTFRAGNQSAFSNFSIIDRPLMQETFSELKFPDESVVDVEYVQELQNLFMKFMAKKDPATGLPYRFPVTTCNIKINENKEIQDKEFFKNVCIYNTEGIFNIYITKSSGKFASCCRLINNMEMIKEYNRFDSFGNAGLSIGSARVSTLNLPRIAREASGNKELFFEILDERMELNKIILLSQRSILQRRIEEGFLKFFDIGWITMSRLFSTFGIIGVWECLNEMGYDIKTKEGRLFAKEVFNFIGKKLEKYSKKEKVAFNMENIPGEGACTVLSRMDTIFFNDEQQKYSLYSNQFVPLHLSGFDLVDRAKIDGELCSYMTGGGICHLNIGASGTPQQIADLINFAIDCGLDHFALSASFNICENGHVTLGKSTDKICIICNGKIKDSVTRIVGYFTKVSSWDENRRTIDFPNRVFNYLKLSKEEQAA